jgi:hypothetical protein
MKRLKDELHWPDSAFCTDQTPAGGAVSVGLGSDGRDVCFKPFSSYEGTPALSIKLSDLIAVGDHLVFDSALANLPNRQLSILSLEYWLNKLFELLMLVTGNRKEIGSNAFDISLQAFDNERGKADFPFDKPLRVYDTNLRIEPFAGNPYINLIDEEKDERWALGLEVFSQVQYIRTDSTRSHDNLTGDPEKR